MQIYRHIKMKFEFTYNFVKRWKKQLPKIVGRQFFMCKDDLYCLIDSLPSNRHQKLPVGFQIFRG